MLYWNYFVFVNRESLHQEIEALNLRLSAINDILTAQQASLRTDTAHKPVPAQDKLHNLLNKYVCVTAYHSASSCPRLLSFSSYFFTFGICDNLLFACHISVFPIGFKICIFHFAMV